MKQRYHVKNMVISKDNRGEVLFEANLGNILEIKMLDNRVLEVKSRNGVLRVDLFIEELAEIIKKSNLRETSGSKSGSHKSTDNRRIRK
jgi:hypothetical protein